MTPAGRACAAGSSGRKKSGDGTLADVLDPLTKFLEFVKPGTAVWWRLKLFDQKLKALQNTITKLPPPR